MSCQRSRSSKECMEEIRASSPLRHHHTTGVPPLTVSQFSHHQWPTLNHAVTTVYPCLVCSPAAGHRKSTGRLRSGNKQEVWPCSRGRTGLRFVIRGKSSGKLRECGAISGDPRLSVRAEHRLTSANNYRRSTDQTWRSEGGSSGRNL